MLVHSTGRNDVGNEHDAARALAQDLDVLDTGLFKTVYVDDTRSTVYKVCDPRHVLHQDGRVKYAAARNLLVETAWSALGRKRRTPGIPPVSLYLVDGQQVLAMPYYPMDAYDIPYTIAAERRRTWQRLGLSDLHEGNYRADSRGRPFVIDMAGWADDDDTLDALPPDVVDTCLVDDDDAFYDDDDACDSCDPDPDYDEDSPEPTTYSERCHHALASCAGPAGHLGATTRKRLADHGHFYAQPTCGLRPCPHRPATIAEPARVITGQCDLPLGWAHLTMAPTGPNGTRGLMWAE